MKWIFTKSSDKKTLDITVVENRLVTRPLENGKRKWKIVNLRELVRTMDLLVYERGFSL
jgi:hypothetical protein